jgi:DMSO/TMAO reductase YedYZ molybdopterin-dependent catalytic subunit
MKERRHFLRSILAAAAFTRITIDPLVSGVGLAWAKVKKIIVPKGAKLESLVNKNPAQLDVRRLEVTALDKFNTMGLTDHETDMDAWRLIVEGNVEHPLSLDYTEIKRLPAVERNVLLICPGVFAQHGRWKGVSVNALLKKAGLKRGVDFVTVRGPKGPYEKVARFTLEDVRADKVLLAYGVNGRILPGKHGFPLRVVAEGILGDDWLKYVYKVSAD